MPRKRKSDASQTELEVSKKLVKDEKPEESSLPPSLGTGWMRQNSNLSHAHPDLPVPSTEPSSNYLLSSSPVERHVRRCSAISQDLQRVNFPRDKDGFIAQVQDVVPGRDISPYTAYLRSGSSPVPYHSRDYGPRAASTPSEGAGEEPELFVGSFESSDDRLDLDQEDEKHHEDPQNPGGDFSGTEDEEDMRHGDLQEPNHSLLEKYEEPAGNSTKGLPIRFFYNSSGIPWDLANSGPRRMLGRRLPPLKTPGSDSSSSSPKKLSHRPLKVQPKAKPKALPPKGTSVRSSTMLRGGLLQTMDDTIVELPANGVQDLRRGLHPVISSLIANFVSLGTFISSRGNEYFCEIDEDYLTDRFNLTGLNTDVQYYQYALDLVTDVFDLDCDDDMREQIEKSARHLYGLVHARYITTTRGLAKMLEKYKKCDFGKCPRVMCQNHPLLPTGMADLPHVQSVKLYCGKCEDLYNPKSSRHSSIDGAYFGTSFQNILFQVYPALIPEKSIRRYEPRVFGFKVHAAATLERWQARKREEMQERLKEVGVERVFREDVADSGGEEMEEDEVEEGDGFVE